MPTKYCLVHYREDVTGISGVRIISDEFDTFAEIDFFCKKNPQITQAENPYFVHIVENTDDGYFFLGDKQPIYIYRCQK